ncbi:MAG: alpha/beta hydrolase [Deltaproteobacteria bacterium]|jgi:fermentation-respiration switch protein FrsA (DUF1100 family)|nr:alpha/beta hydrolase [Deltaproteobacteria bacterium]MBN2688648.1 alpha/beta hydrolase [Deltaproteobacteria bacterium]
MSVLGVNGWSVLWSVLRIALSVYVILIVLAVLFQSHFIFFPERHIAATPENIGLKYEEVAFPTADGKILSGWFIPADKPRGFLLFCHGNAGNISHRLDSLMLFHHLGLSTLIFDYRGYGRSQGRISEEGTYADAEAAWNYLVKVRDVAHCDIIIFGRSLGGAVASMLARHHKPKCLILESTFTSIPDIAARLYPFLPVRILMRFTYPVIDNIRNVKCPVLIVHSRDDDIIPFDHGRRLFDEAHEPKEFLEIRGSHNEGFLISGRRYLEGLESFISRM